MITCLHCPLNNRRSETYQLVETVCCKVKTAQTLREHIKTQIPNVSPDLLPVALPAPHCWENNTRQPVSAGHGGQEVALMHKQSSHGRQGGIALLAGLTLLLIEQLPKNLDSTEYLHKTSCHLLHRLQWALAHTLQFNGIFVTWKAKPLRRITRHCCTLQVHDPYISQVQFIVYYEWCRTVAKFSTKTCSLIYAMHSTHQ